MQFPFEPIHRCLAFPESRRARCGPIGSGRTGLPSCASGFFKNTIDIRGLNERKRAEEDEGLEM